MFITVMSGAGCWELVNPWCSLVILITHLRQRGQVPLDATIALLAEDGHLVNLGEGLEEGPSPAPSMGSPLLQERGTYVLVQIFKCKRGAPTCYESLLEKLDERCPDLAEELRWLSGLPPRAMAGEGVPALCMATRSKALLHGPEGPRDLTHHGQVAELDSDPRGLAVTSAWRDQAQRPSSIPLAESGISGKL
ncbi:Uncharacterized protein C22orf15, partial [Eschrichtius robustus]|nr:Uncharacterized protein C22orf15 [Eschrichtius robustus]